MVRLQLTIDGADRVDVALSRFGAQLGDLRRFWTQYAAPKLYRDIQDNFDQTGALSGGWAPLSPRYAAWKATHYPGRPLMVRTGRLKQSLTHDGPEGILETSHRVMVIGTRIRYAKHHQRGGSTAGRPPQRRLLFLIRGASQSLGRLLHAFAVDEARRAGLRTRAALLAGAGAQF